MVRNFAQVWGVKLAARAALLVGRDIRSHRGQITRDAARDRLRPEAARQRDPRATARRSAWASRRSTPGPRRAPVPRPPGRLHRRPPPGHRPSSAPPPPCSPAARAPCSATAPRWRFGASRAVGLPLDMTVPGDRAPKGSASTACAPSTRRDLRPPPRHPGHQPGPDAARPRPGDQRQVARPSRSTTPARSAPATLSHLAEVISRYPSHPGHAAPTLYRAALKSPTRSEFEDDSRPSAALRPTAPQINETSAATRSMPLPRGG